MGDRCNIIVKHTGSSGVVLYTHWAGSEALRDTLDAIASQPGQNRRTDEGYLTRELGSEYGFGIFPWIGDDPSTFDDDAPAVVVDIPAQTVTQQGARTFAFGERLDS